MNKHVYLRAYMAGIVVPTIFLLVAMTAYCTLRYFYNFPVPIERVIVFPMAAVPNIWGLWNILYVRTVSRRHVPLGFYGAVLPLLLAPLGYLVTRLLGFSIQHLAASVFPIAFPIGLIAYYLAWKYLVGFLNAEMGIA